MKHIVGLFFVILLFLAFSCSPQKRLIRLKKNHPEIFKTDTIYIRDTTFIKSDQKDTIFKFSKDTVIIKEDRLTMKYYHTRDSVYLYGECAGDTIVKEVPVISETLIPDPQIPFWVWVIIGILGFLNLILIVKK